MTAIRPQQTDPSTAKQARRARLWGTAAVGSVLVAGLLGGGVWLARRPIAAAVAQQYLAGHGVEGRITFTELGSDRIVASVLLGPPDEPELKIDRLEVLFASGGGDALGQAREVRLSGVTLRATYDHGKLKLGRLQRLVDQFSHPAKPGGPSPDLHLTRGQLILMLEGHEVTAQLDGDMVKGQLQRAHLGLDGQSLQLAGLSADVQTLRADLTPEGTGFHLTAQSVSPHVKSTAAEASDLHLGLDLHGDRPLMALDPKQVRASLTAQAGTVKQANLSAQGLDLQADYKGRVSELGALNGDLTAVVSTRLLTDGKTSASQSTTSVQLAGLQLARKDAKFTGQARLTASSQTASAQLLVGAEPVRLTKIAGKLDGPVALADNGLSGVLTGDLTGASQTSAASAERLSAHVPVFGTDPVHHKALAAALTGLSLQRGRFGLSLTPDGGALRLIEPVKIAAASGAELTLSQQGPVLVKRNGESISGGFALSLARGGLPELNLAARSYQFASGKGSAELMMGARFDYGVFRQISTRTPARYSLAGGTSRLTLPGCFPVTLDRVAGKPDDLVRDIKAELCPSAGTPLLTLKDKDWRLQAQLRGAQGRLPKSEATVSAARGLLRFYGAADGPAGTVALDRADILDAALEPRFKPLFAKGQVALASGHWNGRFEVLEAARGNSVATASLTHDMPRQTGSAHVSVPNMVFSPKGLQPGDLSWPAAKLIWRATGEAHFEGDYHWSGDAPVTSSGKARVHLTSFHTQAGVGHELNTELNLVDLGPLTSALNQTVSVQQLDALSPVTKIVARYHLTPTALEVNDATMSAAGGSVQFEPMSLLLKAKSSFSGRMHVTSIDLGSALKDTDLGDNLALKAVVSGTVPFVMTPDGVRVANGKLTAVAPGRLSIRRQALGVAEVSSTTMKDMAYQALENLAFDQLEATLESRPEGRLGMIFHVRGRHDPPVNLPARISMFDLLRGKIADAPLNLPKGTEVNLTLDTSVNFDEIMQSLSPGRSASGPDAAAPPAVQKP